jgi:hypothetical protein
MAMSIATQSSGHGTHLCLLCLARLRRTDIQPAGFFVDGIVYPG